MTIEDPMQTISRLAAWLVVGAVLVGPGAPSVAGSARTLYTKVLNRERDLRDAESRPTLRELRNAVIAYENVVRRYPTSGYSDNALWQAANLALLAYERFDDEADLRRGLRLLARLRQEYRSPRSRDARKSSPGSSRQRNPHQRRRLPRRSLGRLLSPPHRPRR